MTGRSAWRPITADLARRAVEEVRGYAKAGDHEAAHAREDRLREWVLDTISRGNVTKRGAADLATIALATDAIEFWRWCA